MNLFINIIKKKIWNEIFRENNTKYFQTKISLYYH